jgi:hypothetical protein
MEGTEYTLTTEMFDNGEQCILGWITLNDNGFGARFAIKGNLLNSNNEPEWPEFLDYFLCPIQRNREQQLNLIGIL